MPSAESLNLAVYHGLPMGGAKRVMMEQVRRLSRRHRLTIYSIGASGDELRGLATVGQVVPFEPGRLFRSPFGRLNQRVRSQDLQRLQQAAQEMAQEMNTRPYDAVLVHPCRYTSAPWILQFLSAPSLYYCHEHNRSLHDAPIARPYHKRRPFAERLDSIDPLLAGYRQRLGAIERSGLQQARAVLVNSEFTRQSVARLTGVLGVVCYPGVDAEQFRPLGKERQQIVLAVGSLAPEKGFDVIIEALARLPAARRPRLVIAGPQAQVAEQAYLAGLARQWHVEWTVQTALSDPELVELYNAALLVAYTPHAEPFGLVPLEAMACATPVVGVAEGGVRETVVDGVTGYLAARHADALAEKIAGLLDNPVLRAEMGAAGRARVEQQWTWERSVAQLEERLLQVGSRIPAAAAAAL